MQVPVKPIILRDVLVNLKSVDAVPVDHGDFEAHVSQVQFDPTTPTVTFKGMTPRSSRSFAGDTTWMCALGLAQDWETPGALSRLLHENAGSELEFTFEPKRGGTTVTATIVALPGAIGGGVDSVPQASVQLPVQGWPAIAAIA
jgi:hypothetical protein